MKWQQRVRVITGLSCMQIVFNLAFIAVLVTGWKMDYLVTVGLGLCLFYGLALGLMFALQRQRGRRLREFVDFLEELTSNWYFGMSLVALWLLSKIVYPHWLLLAPGLLLLAGPALMSLLMKSPGAESGDFPPEQNERR